MNSSLRFVINFNYELNSNGTTSSYDIPQLSDPIDNGNKTRARSTYSLVVL